MPISTAQSLLLERQVTTRAALRSTHTTTSRLLSLPVPPSRCSFFDLSLPSLAGSAVCHAPGSLVVRCCCLLPPLLLLPPPPPRSYNGMHSGVEFVVKNLTDELQAHGLYSNSVLLFFGDNGGTYEHGQPVPGSSNYPLRGHKYSWFEVRRVSTRFCERVCCVLCDVLVCLCVCLLHL